MLREEQILPYQTTSLTGATVLVLAPHPDDETIGCGGALALHRAHGDPVKVLVLTDGARAEGPDAMGADYIALREREARAALAVLGIEEVEFWRLPDRGLTVEPANVAGLAEALQEYRPTLLYLPSPLEPHPDHAVAAQLVWAALREARIPTTLCLYEVGLPIRPNVLVDITPVLSQKERALACYASQLKLNDYRSKILGLNRYRSYTLPAEVTHAEAFWRLASEEACAASLELVRWQMAKEVESARVTDLPLVSIIVRTLNRPLMLREALQSILAQTYRNLEVIVVNDGGQDVEPTLAEFRPFMRVISITHENPAGRPQALNAGLRQAKGEFIAYLDDDDVYYPDHIETLVNFLRHSNFRVAYTGVYWAYQRMNLATRSYESYDKKQLFSKNLDPDWLLFQNYIPNNSIMHARSCLDEVGVFDEQFEALEDWDLWIRLSQRYPFQFIPAVSTEYRIREDGTNITYSPARSQLMTVSTSRLFEKHSKPREQATQRLFERMRSRLAQLEEELSASESSLERQLRDVERDREGWQRHAKNLERELGELRVHVANLEREREELRGHIASLERERDERKSRSKLRFLII